jgi:two-component system phosphate regulon sensor histidine kinase PhoR
VSPPEEPDRDTGTLLAEPRPDARTPTRGDGGERKVEELQREIVHRLDELDAAKSDFVARVSHELRSPLTSILGYLEVLQEGTVGATNREQRRMLEIMDRNTHRLMALVEDLLTTERIGAGAFRVHPTRVALSGVVDRVMHTASSGIHDHGLRCTVAIEPGIELDADPDELERMLTNLVSNSIKFTRPGGQIDLEARTESGSAVITVRDTGIGVPVDEQSRLFTRFFRSAISEELETQGAGLGLFIVKQIVEAHRGAIAVASTPGEGTVVTVRLPLGRA